MVNRSNWWSEPSRHLADNTDLTTGYNCFWKFALRFTQHKCDIDVEQQSPISKQWTTDALVWLSFLTMNASSCTKCIWRTKAPVPWSNFSCQLEAYWNKPLFLLPIIPGSDKTKAGTITSAGGTVSGKASKAAIGEMLESQSADLKFTADRGKDRKGGGTTRNAKKGQETENKKLQKDIKAFLNKIHLHALHMYWEGVFNWFLFLNCLHLLVTCLNRSHKILSEASG